MHQEVGMVMKGGKHQTILTMSHPTLHNSPLFKVQLCLASV